MYYTIQDMEGLPQHDINLIVEAEDMPYEDIQTDKAITERGKKMLRYLSNRKYYRDVLHDEVMEQRYQREHGFCY